MKKLIQTTGIAALLLSIFSFTNEAELPFVGIYGVSESDPAQIELTLNADHTFTYQDFSNPVKKIDVHGNWEVRNNRIVLKDYLYEFPFHSKWKITKNGMMAKSRKGLTYYSLGKK